MTCLDFRRLLLTGEPESALMRAHRQQCPACEAHAVEHALFERELGLGLSVPVPLGFEERLLDRLTVQGAPAQALPNPGRRRMLVVAATTVVTAGLGGMMWYRRDDPLAMDCIQFVMKEEAKSIMMGAMPRAEAVKALAEVVPLQRIEQIGQILHIGPCPFNGITAYHVVMSVMQEKITLLVMPGLMVSARKRAGHDGLHARVVPLRNGSVGMVGSNAGLLDNLAGVLRSQST